MAFSGWTNDQIAQHFRALQEENVALRNKLMDASEENFNLQASMVADEAERKYNASLEIVNLQSELNFKNREIEEQKREHAKVNKEMQELRKKLVEDRDIEAKQSKLDRSKTKLAVSKAFFPAVDLSHLPSPLSHAVININAVMDQLLLACSLPINAVRGVKMDSSIASQPSRPQSRTPTSHDSKPVCTLSIQTKAKEVYDSLLPLLPTLVSCLQRIAAQLFIDQEWLLLPLLRLLNDVCTIIFSSVNLTAAGPHQSLLHLLTLIWQLLPFSIVPSLQKDINHASRKNLARRFDEMETVPLTATPANNTTITRRQRVMARINIVSEESEVTKNNKFRMVPRVKVEVDEIGEVIEATLDSLKPLIQSLLLTSTPHEQEATKHEAHNQSATTSMIVQFLAAIIAKCGGNEVLTSLSRYLTVLVDYNQHSPTSVSSPTTMIQALLKSMINDKGVGKEQLWYVISQLLPHDMLYEKFLFAEIALLRQYKSRRRVQKKNSSVENNMPVLLFALQELKLPTDSKLEASTLRCHNASICWLRNLLHHRQDTALMIFLQYIPFDDGSGSAVHEEHSRHEDEMDVDDNDDAMSEAKRRKSPTPQTAAEQSQSLPKSKRGKLFKGSSSSKRKSSNSTATAAANDDDNENQPFNCSIASKKRNTLDESTVMLPDDHELFEWRTFAMADLAPGKIRHGKHFLTAFVQYWFELWQLCDLIPALVEAGNGASQQLGQEQQQLLIKLVIDTTRLLNTIVGGLTREQQQAVLRDDALPWIQAFMVRYYMAGLNPVLQIAEEDVNHLDAVSSNF